MTKHKPKKPPARLMIDAADERAKDNGCLYDQARVDHVVDFITGHLRLYEGEYAGQPVELMKWQIQLIERLFGWVRYSDDWGRYVRRFNKCSLWVPKKNGKSPTCAMIGLYLLVADGEQGQKVFSAAKDGRQAGIMHAHARHMVEQSPVLSKELKINKSSGRIYHERTRSTYDILAGDNIASQHGHNGSVIIDEVHVVNERLARVLEFMGASRSEPIQFEASTAGNNPEGYGKKQFDYGQAVAEGMIFDDSFLFVNHSAPQAATDKECGQVKTWKAANPSWGTTIKRAEFEQSYKRAKRSIPDFTSWKQLRLNVWQSSASPWLRKSDWEKCQEKYTAADLAGQECFLGLDLSRTRDMTAAVLAFRDDDTYRLLPYFWLPEDTTKDHANAASYQAWHQAGHLELTAGNVLDYSVIERRIAELSEQFDIAEVVYDPWSAEELTQRLEIEHGIPRTKFKQTITSFAAPTAEMERMVLNGNLKHNDHPILTWQALHTQVKADNNNNYRPVKPPNANPKKIDGIVAAVMAISRAMSEDGAPNLRYYETNEIELL